MNFTKSFEIALYKLRLILLLYIIKHYNLGSNKNRKFTKNEHPRIGKAYSEKNEFNFRDSMTDSISSSENSFKVTVQVDHEKIHKQSKPSNHNH